MLHWFKEATMLTGTEADAKSPQNPEEESPAGNPDAGVPSQNRGGVTNSADCHRSLRRSHQQETPMQDSPFTAEESLTMLTTTEALNFNHFKTNLHYLFFNNH